MGPAAVRREFQLQESARKRPAHAQGAASFRDTNIAVVDCCQEEGVELPATGSGFSWRSGSERETTGIWMWNQPYFRKVSSGEDVAIVLIDTQVSEKGGRARDCAAPIILLLVLRRCTGHV